MSGPSLPASDSIPGLDVLLSWPALRQAIGLSRPQIWKLRQLGAFPAPVRLSRNRIAWRQSEVRAWVESRSRA
jgi:prophage regulatory protein